MTSVLGTPGTFATWNAVDTVQAGSVKSGIVVAKASLSPSLNADFSADTLAASGRLSISNTGTVPADFSTALALSSDSSTVLAGSIAVLIWATDAATPCTTPVSPPQSTTWRDLAPLTGTIGAKTTIDYCVATSLPAGEIKALPDGSTVSPTIAVTLSVGSWRSTASVTATQTVSNDAVVLKKSARIAPSAPLKTDATAPTPATPSVSPATPPPAPTTKQTPESASTPTPTPTESAPTEPTPPAAAPSTPTASSTPPAEPPASAPPEPSPKPTPTPTPTGTPAAD